MNVFISGLGLIGGSIAKIIAKSRVDTQITAFDIDKQNIDYLQKQNIVRYIDNFVQGAKSADIIILAASVNVIKQNLNELNKIKFDHSVLVTDVGSSKASILKMAEKLTNPKIKFLGGHPMSGSHLSGSQFSDINLFKKHYYFLVNQNATENQIDMFKALMRPANVIFKNMPASKHDDFVSLVSHLPHALIFNFMDSVSQEAKLLGVDLTLAGGGLYDTTRIAMGDAQMWTDVILNNSSKILEQLNIYEKNLQDFKHFMEEKDKDAIFSMIERANKARTEMEG
ncbi:prephenate dehydrogenase [Apilactobacillus ozensis DSM 23829 = JCM 17196]|uniref:Prephenate dehydrogenase n=1 Tax=Apilactobacillus ozensis DSM 23829 = JCM 17196 TaxID=1423781 RepID=A0A0R2ATJ4_9LACO|nr:prephenate dehydrogenase/arogenate dehydrogenase family protein [Apilactobacillus ozensis]KRM67595.1 prephenate dehydrogenase [Apilactobacillus ozensis DSM 23829 = JCM 17196]